MVPTRSGSSVGKRGVFVGVLSGKIFFIFNGADLSGDLRQRLVGLTQSK